MWANNTCGITLYCVSSPVPVTYRRLSIKTHELRGRQQRFRASKWGGSPHEVFPSFSLECSRLAGLASTSLRRLWLHLCMLEMFLSITVGSQRKGLTLLSPETSQCAFSILLHWSWPANSQVSSDLWAQEAKNGVGRKPTYVLKRFSVFIWSWRN